MDEASPGYSAAQAIAHAAVAADVRAGARWPRASARCAIADALRGCLGARGHAGALCARRSTRRCGSWATSAWFQEYWIGRNRAARAGGRVRPGRTRAAHRCCDSADALYDSGRRGPPQALGAAAAGCGCHPRGTWPAPWRRRWTFWTQLPRDAGDDELYFFRLVALHEAMHAEAACYMARTLGVSLAAEACRLHRHELPAPARAGSAGAGIRGWATTGRASPSTTSCGPHEVHLRRLQDRCPAGDLGAVPGLCSRLEAIEEQRVVGRARLGLASASRDGPIMKRRAHDPDAAAAAPERARSASVVPLGGTRACRPRSQWECAALTLPVFSWGQVWEWTASTFQPYPGFTAASLPRLFRAVVRQPHACCAARAPATSAVLAHPRYRNFFEPHRSDVFAGFRSCA